MVYPVICLFPPVPGHKSQWVHPSWISVPAKDVGGSGRMRRGLIWITMTVVEGNSPSPQLHTYTRVKTWKGSLLSHWGRDKMAAISQTIFSNAYSWEFRLTFHRTLFLRVKLTILKRCFGSWLGADQATSHYLNQLWLIYWRIYTSLILNDFTEYIA